MVTLSIILYIIGIAFCIIFAVRTLDELNFMKEDVTLIKDSLENFMATASDLQTIANTLLTVAQNLKTLVEQLHANSVSPADLDPVVATLNQVNDTLSAIS